VPDSEPLQRQVTDSTVPTGHHPDHPVRKLAVSEQIRLLNDLVLASPALLPGEVFVTLHPDHPPEETVMTVFQEQDGQRLWPDAQPWTAEQLSTALSQERHCPPTPVKRHTLKIAAQSAALPGGETLMVWFTAVSVLTCLLLTPHLPGLSSKLLWGACVMVLLNLAEHTEHLRGLMAYVLTARIRRCSETRPPRTQDEAPEHPDTKRDTGTTRPSGAHVR